VGDEIRVLITDDQPSVRRGLRLFLDLQDDVVVVGEAADGQEAVEIAGATRPDVVLMDLMMPRLDGVGAAQRIRASHPQTKVLVLTSFVDDDRLFPALGAGVSGYLVKDATPKELLEAVRTVYRGDPYLHPAAARRVMDSFAPLRTPLGTATVLFTDIEQSTRIVSELGDVAARALFRGHDLILREILQEHGGTEVKHLGDGLMAVFQSARHAVACSVEMQRRLAAMSGDERVRVKIGLNTGEVIAEEHDYFGQAVIAAARVAGVAAGGQILVSEATKGLTEDSGFHFSDHGERELKGLGNRRLFEVRWDSEAA
jgi:DNA-binding NarL/FixJ family response regulator